MSQEMDFASLTLNVKALKTGAERPGTAGTEITATAAELNVLDGVTAGTVTASKAVVVDANKDVAGFNIIRSSGDHLKVQSAVTNTDIAGKTVRVNSITNTGTADSLIGFQSKPGQGASMANNVIGCEISPRVNDTFGLTGSGSLIGAHVDAYLKGTTGNIAGDVRGAQIELVTDDAGTRTISGDVVGLRFRAAFSGTITGDMVVIRVEKAETQTNSKQWEYLFELTDDNGTVWAEDHTTEVDATGAVAGAIKVRVNGADRWIALYDTAPTP